MRTLSSVTLFSNLANSFELQTTFEEELNTGNHVQPLQPWDPLAIQIHLIIVEIDIIIQMIKNPMANNHFGNISWIPITVLMVDVGILEFIILKI